MTLSKLLEVNSSLSESHIYMYTQEEFSEHTIVAVLASEEVDAIEDGVFESEESAAAWEADKDECFEGVKKYLSEHNLHYIFSFQTLQQIVDNAKMQERSVSITQLVKAFSYYVKHDAFIDFSTD